MGNTKIDQLAQLGQSIWLDNMSREMIDTGSLKSLINQGLRGQTSNPSIFKQAIASSNDYDKRIQQLKEQGKSTFDIYDDLTLRDVGDAADLFRGLYDQTKGLDGYVSLEINPKLANDYEKQRDEGTRLWKVLNRPNVMIKVPATKNGCRAIEDLTAQGVNVNVTLIFSAEQYQEVVWAYFKGLKRFADSGGNLSKLRSVASVFVSRIDTAIDKTLPENSPLRGKAAVANSEIVYHKFQNSLASPEFKALQAKGANIQRVLWGSTGTKEPKYSDIKYVTELIGPHTVNTMPDKTLMAFMDHGVIKSVLPGDAAQAQRVIEQLREQKIDINIVCLKLLQEGVESFEKAFEDLMASIEEKSKRLASR